MLSLVDRVLDHGRHSPDAPALSWRGEITTYAELAALSWSAHAEIVAAGGAGAVGVLARKSPAAIGLVLGAMLARRPVVVPSPGAPPAALRAMYEAAGCELVLSPDDDWDAVRAGLVDRTVRPGRQPAAPVPAPPADDPARVGLVLTTSGSTGVPKLVPLSVGAIARFADWAHGRFGLGPGRGVLSYGPLNFDLCLFDVWATLAAGGRVLLLDPDQTGGARLLEAMLDERVHVLEAVPMLYELLVEAAGHTGDQLEAAEHVLFTGDAIRPGCLAALPKLFPHARFYNLYGSTETNDSFLHEVRVEAEQDAPLSLGEPLPGVRALLRDRDGVVVTGPGVGELLVSTPFQTSGYLNAPTTGKFVAHTDGVTYFRTGDVVRRHDDGRLVLEGRNDFMVKVRGQQVNLQEVERALLGHEHVLDVAVVAEPHPLNGKRLKAVVRRRPGSDLTSVDVRALCADQLSPASVPSSVRVTEAPLPHTSTGKINRRAAAEAALTDVTLTLSAPESEQVREVCAATAALLGDQPLDSEDTIATLALAGCALPPRLVRALVTFRCAGNRHGVLVVENLPVDRQLPPTPLDGQLHGWQVAPVSTVAQLAVMAHIGDLFAFADEKHGQLVQDIVPIDGAAGRQENSGTVLLELHTENGFHPVKPDYVSLLCLRPDAAHRGNTLTSSISRAVPDLSAECVRTLREPLFRIRYSSSFEGGASVGRSRPLAVLSGPVGDPDLVADFHAMEPETAGARAALVELEEALRRALAEVRQEAGTLLIVDNRVATHGRTAFTARYDGTDRWLRRTFAVADLRRSRGMRDTGSRLCVPLSVLDRQRTDGAA
jgi:acyl-coenzyme A synthetase/AMP-(fatty) acid ligase/alpha-ketoglutarate-dependent taurine dioxygenase